MDATWGAVVLTTDGDSFDEGVTTSFIICIPSFVRVVLIPYTPTAANPHHQNHRVALPTVSDTFFVTVPEAMREADSRILGDVSGILCDISLLRRSDADRDASDIESFTRPLVVRAAAFADRFASSPSRTMDRRASRAYRPPASLASILAFVSEWRRLSVAAVLAAWVAVVAAREAESDAVEVRESKSCFIFDVAALVGVVDGGVESSTPTLPWVFCLFDFDELEDANRVLCAREIGSRDNAIAIDIGPFRCV
mmetsp:Transcript_6720/g.16548  ORF Transcript_6720/g.16548 Transcript_6720/m.16548 type:complete len:253 (+) Transcript_6720:508-1266(+)